MNIQGLLPAITSPLLGQSANAAKPAATSNSNASSSSSSSTNSTSASSLQETFLNLLVTELQNQDPTAPVDPTQMVGQLVSLNQLDQLISINATLSGLANPPSSTSAAVQHATTLPLSTMAASSGPSGASANATSAAAAALQQFQTTNTRAASMNSLMNLYGNMGAPAQNPTY
jgi:flagellar basal-body rod modification protein FlgD